MVRFLYGPAQAAVLLSLGLVVASATVAQPVPCAEALAAAEAEYREQVYLAVEPLVLDCVYHPDATPREQVAAYRLLALALIKQDRLAEARETIVKLLGVDFDYQADLSTDLPLYVGLVNTVRGQLRVDRPGAAPPDGSPTRGAPDERGALIDINTATVEMLDTVPGIGPTLAERIVTFRSQHGPFRSVADLESVRGIGPRSIERMAPFLQASEGSGVQMAAGGGEASDVRPAGPLGTEPLVNLNTASVEALDTLPGIGPALAARIVEFRETHGPFRRVDDVLEVRGIGPRTLEGFADRVTVD